MVGMSRFVVVALTVQLILIQNGFGLFKPTKIECQDINTDLIHVNACRLKAVSRDVAEITFRIQLKKAMENILLNVALSRKYNTFQPFFINKTVDMCAFLKSRKEAVLVDILYKLIDPYTNANHTCPYEGEIIVDHFRPLHNNLILPLPTGDYLIQFGLYEKNNLLCHLVVWFTFKELEAWEILRKKSKKSKSLH